MRVILSRLFLDVRLYLANQIVCHIPSHRFRLWFYRQVMSFKIGSGTSIFMGAWVDTPGGLEIGANSTINQRCRLDSRGGLSIGSNVSISAEVCILTAEHDVQSRSFQGVKASVRIGDYVFVGTRSMILPGVVLGRGAVIAAGAVVTKDVPEFSIVGGIPAKVIGTRSSDQEYSASYPRLFH